MRKLMFLSIGFAFGCLLGSYLLFGTALAITAGVFVLLGAFLFLLRKRPATIAAFIALGLGLGAGWTCLHDCLFLDDARNYDGKVLKSEIVISDYSYETTYGIAAKGVITIADKQYQVNTYLKCEDLQPGDKVVGQFRFRFTANGGRQDATYHPGKGIFLLAYAIGETQVINADNVPIRFYPALLRRTIQNTLDTVLPGDVVGFGRALLLGDSSKLSNEDDTAFKVSGIRHVIAVSGLHVSILFSLIYVLTGKKRVLTALLGIPILVLFAAIAGFTPSIMRACIMQCLVIAALLLKKEYDPPTALSFAVLVMLAINPMVITSVSFQLSVGCIIGIFLFCSKIQQFFLRVLHAPKGKSFQSWIVRWFVGSVSVTLSAMSLTTPLSAYYFGAVSIIGVLTNLLTLWVISFIFYGLMLACLLGVVWLAAGKVVGLIMAWPIRYVLFMAKTLASSPISSLYTTSIYVVMWIVFALVLIGVFLVCKRKHPFVLITCIVVGMILSISVSYLEPKLDDFTVTVLDVGQGQCIILKSQDKTYMVDCGGQTGEQAADIAAQNLLSQGITRIDALILTHFDDDHAGGAQYLLNRIPADTLYLPDCADDGELKETLTDSFSEIIVWVRDKHKLSGSWGDMMLYPGNPDKGDNDGGLCILFQAETCDILITGDWGTAEETALVQAEELPELELLVVGHHGSATSTSFALLSETRPKAAVISVGENNSYGHPTDETLQRLDMFGCKIWRTDLDGTVTFGR